MGDLGDLPSALADEAQPSILKRIPEPQYPINVYQGPPLCMSEQEQRTYIRWRYNTRNVPPRMIWLREPNVKLVYDVALPYVLKLCPQMVDIQCSFLARGAYNMAYTVTAMTWNERVLQSFVLRIAAPTYPYFKTESEVATMELVRHSTDVPVPKVYFYSSTWKNDVGFEWILMEKVHGVRAVDVYHKWTWTEKHNLAGRLALWTSQLAQIRSNRIGSVFMYRSNSQLVFYLGRCVSFTFFIERNLRQDVSHGPFRDIWSYFKARLSFQKLKMVQLEQEARIKESRPRENPTQTDTQSNLEIGVQATQKYSDYALNVLERTYALADRDDAADYNWREFSASYLRRLLSLLSHQENTVYSACHSLRHTQTPLCTILAHPDLAERNLIVNRFNTCVSVLDWEYLELRPACFSAGYPLYMWTHTRTLKPQMEEFRLADHSINWAGFSSAVEEYENGFLRAIFKVILESIAPDLAGQVWADTEELRRWRKVHKIVHEANVFKGGNAAWVDKHQNFFNGVL